jgi:hypothetical protein
MTFRYLYNTSGKYVAFISQNNVFDPNSEWIGYVLNGNEFYWKDGKFAGYIMDDDRVLKNQLEIERFPAFPPFPPFPPFAPFPPLPRLPKLPAPFPYIDIFEKSK